MRKAELIAFLQDEDRQQEEPPTREPELEVSQPLAVALSGSPLTKRQLKRRRNKNSKLNKKFKNLSKEIDNLKSQIEELEIGNCQSRLKYECWVQEEEDKVNEKGCC